LVAGNQDGQTSDWLNYDLDDAFAPGVRPVVFSQIVSQNDRAAATTRIRFTSDSEFQIKIREQEANIQDHAAETVSFIAIQTGIGTTGESLFQAIVTPDSVTHNIYSLGFDATFEDSPAFFANLQTHDGSDTASVRYQTLDASGATFFVEEEKSNDSEINHTTEVVGVLAIEIGDIVARDNGSKGFADSAIALGRKNRSAMLSTSISSDPALWEAVRIQQSWGETSYSFDQHDAKLDHDRGDVRPTASAEFRNSLKTLAPFDVHGKTEIDDSESKFTAQMVTDARRDELQLTGAVEVQRAEETSFQFTIDLQDAQNAEIKSIDNAFAIEFDWLV
jgi:hypothetical protein